jgi:hypothetical protein
MTPAEFESELKSTDASISYGESFCIVAAEQIKFKEGCSFDNPEALIFSKCQGQEFPVKILWTGSEYASGFKELMNELEPVYQKTLGNTKGYVFSHEGYNYVFTFERTNSETGRMLEILRIGRYKN